MGRLDEYSEDERAAIVGRCNCQRREYGVCPVHGLQDPTVERLEKESLDAEQFWADAKLGEKVRAMLAGHTPAVAFVSHVYDRPGSYVQAAWDWFRRELLGEEPGSLKTGGAVGSPRDLARRIADHLFTFGASKKASRLIGERPGGGDYGGWGYEPAVNAIENLLIGSEASHDR